MSRGLPTPLVYHVPHASHAAVSHGACHQACHFLYFIYSNIADHDKSNCLANSFQVCFHSPSALPVSDHGTRHHMRVPHCATKLTSCSLFFQHVHDQLSLISCLWACEKGAAKLWGPVLVTWTSQTISVPCATCQSCCGEPWCMSSSLSLSVFYIF